MTIRILMTGGTIDGRSLSPGKSKRPDSFVPRMLKEAKVSVPLRTELICQKDSRLLNETDRRRILSSCMGSEEKQIVITHGTYTLAETAAYLGPKIKDKTVVLTGSMVPFSENGSDAMFNLGAALAAVQLLGSGVYVLIGARVFDWDNVRKNQKTKKFEEITEHSEAPRKR